jgi:hypothetical protein
MGFVGNGDLEQVMELKDAHNDLADAFVKICHRGCERLQL